MSTESYQRSSNPLGSGLGNSAQILLPQEPLSYLNASAPTAPPAFKSKMISHQSPENLMLPSYSLSRTNNLGLIDNHGSNESQINLNVFVNPAQQSYQQSNSLLGQADATANCPQLPLNNLLQAQLLQYSNPLLNPQYLHLLQLQGLINARAPYHGTAFALPAANLLNGGSLPSETSTPLLALQGGLNALKAHPSLSTLQSSPAVAPAPLGLNSASLEKPKPATVIIVEEQQDAGAETAAYSPKAADLKQKDLENASESGSDSEAESNSESDGEATPLDLKITATADEKVKKKRGRKSEPIDIYVKKSQVKIEAERAKLLTAKADGVDAKGRQRMRNKISALQDRIKKKNQLIHLESTVQRQDQKIECLMEIVKEVLAEEQYGQFLKLKNQRWAERFQEAEESEDDEMDLSEEPVQKKRKSKIPLKQSKPAPKAATALEKRVSKRIAKKSNKK